MRLLDTILSANRNLRRNKMRTALTVIAVFIGAFTIALTAGVNAGVNDYIDRQLGGMGGDGILEVMARQESGTGMPSGGPAEYKPDVAVSGDAFGVNLTMLTPSDIGDIAKVKNVKEVMPAVVASPTFVQGSNDKKFKMTTSQMIDGINIDIAEGRAPRQSSKDYEIALQHGYAVPLGFKSDADAIGEKLRMTATTPLGIEKTVTATIVGTMNNSLMSQSGALVSNSLNTAIHDISTDGVDSATRDRFLAAVAVLDDTSEEAVAQTKADINKLNDKRYEAFTVDDRIGVISSVINAVTIALIGFGAIALIAAVFGVANTLYMAVQERTREIGLMKAMGMSSRSVFTLFSVEALLIGFWGSLVGIITAFGVGQVINSVAEDTFLKDLTGFVLVQFPALYIAVIMVTIMTITYLAGTLPARRASKQNPIDALRYE
jgi:putative ABC transport system permease protein